MIAALILAGVVIVALAGALIVQVRQAASERDRLIDVIVAKHAGELKTIRSTPEPPAAIKDFRRDLERDLEAMGYEPGSVPMQPHGF